MRGFFYQQKLGAMRRPAPCLWEWCPPDSSTACLVFSPYQGLRGDRLHLADGSGAPQNEAVLFWFFFLSLQAYTREGKRWFSVVVRAFSVAPGKHRVSLTGSTRKDKKKDKKETAACAFLVAFSSPRRPLRYCGRFLVAACTFSWPGAARWKSCPTGSTENENKRDPVVVSRAGWPSCLPRFADCRVLRRGRFLGLRFAGFRLASALQLTLALLG